MVKKKKKWMKAGLIILPMLLAALLIFPFGSASAHCDAVDGPVVTAAKQALEENNVDLVLPYVKKEGEAEVVEAFKRTMDIRYTNKDVRSLADHWFYETVVRVHREGEGAAYTGLKPAGGDYGPALPAAEKALETESTEEVKKLILSTIEEEIDKRFEEVQKAGKNTNNVQQTREYVELELQFQKYIHELYLKAVSDTVHDGDAEAH